jgi:hypothetical protein
MQLTQKQADQLYPYKSDKLWFLMHAYDEEKTIERCLKSVLPYTENIVVGIDDRTTDRTEEIAKSLGAKTFRFKWIHSFSYAKNLCIENAMSLGMKYGDWILVMGSDFELISIDMDFIEKPRNFFGQFEVPEFHREGTQYVTRNRKLLWRHHPFIYWEKLVHEEAIYSAYRLTGLGIVFGTAEWKQLPCVGEMMHYGFFEDGGEQGEVFWRKKCYYAILTQLGKIMSKCNLPETQEGILKALKIVYNNEDINDIDKAIDSLLERYMAGDIPQGLSPYEPQSVGAEHE